VAQGYPLLAELARKLSWAFSDVMRSVISG
jgi:hypothetical protein